MPKPHPLLIEPKLNQIGVYWYTLEDCRKLLGCSLTTIRKYLPNIPAHDRCLVTRRIGRGSRTTRYWRISPQGLKYLGHKTGQAPYM